MTYRVETIRTESRVTAVVRTSADVSSLGTVISESLNTIYAYFSANPHVRPGHNVVLYRGSLDDIEVGVIVTSAFESTDGVICSSTPGGRVAWTRHARPYARLPNAHKAVQAWCIEHGHSLAGIDWEEYGDWHDDPQELTTDVYYLPEGP